MIDEKKLIDELKQSGMIADNEYGSAMVGMIESQPKVGGWITCSERLPEEPEELPTEDDSVERMILDGEFEEYIVTIYGAERATTLYYVGNGKWYDEVSSECYKVIAWQPLPESYKEE
ncbi:MAG: DUF551 domain-containing protein [Lachnospiraceae bacterium]|nr:DUF551 domain-containing protein [Lachnospiraceae bacterium]MDE6184619.1 DUF551 domain-containing protein [Lachnospiraceae bacterium]MDE7285528.1 DUF551 domain-containing protein [Lachnospiraceae bacterium]